VKLTKETLKRIIKEELEATMNEGDRRFRSKYDKNPLKDMGWEHTGKPSTIIAGDPTEAQESISNILMVDAGLRISRAAMATKEITNKIYEEGFDLTGYLTNTVGIPATQAPDIANKIMMEINQ
jgi:hypothetical protein